jgi:RNase H-fold protein (predicted Holliday junction resolvase)
MTTRLLAVDPGREKCGLAVVDRQQGVLARTIAPTAQLPCLVEKWISRYDCRTIVIGDRTAGAGAVQVLERLLSERKIDRLASVDEHKSSLEARARYWQDHPPVGWRRFVPEGLRVPPCAIDDYAAIILAERYFQADVKKL